RAYAEGANVEHLALRRFDGIARRALVGVDVFPFPLLNKIVGASRGSSAEMIPHRSLCRVQERANIGMKIAQTKSILGLKFFKGVGLEVGCERKSWRLYPRGSFLKNESLSVTEVQRAVG